jgi:Tfp pilus assembly protein PilN
VGPFALWNTLKTYHRFEKEEVVALIDLGAEKTGIHLFQDGILQFSREVTPAGADITRAIMEGAGLEEEANLLYERAERIKQKVGILLEGDQEKMVDVLRQAQDESINLSKISFLVRPVLERLVAEIGRSLDYYRNQFHRERIDRVLLTGGGANLKNIASYLAGELRLPVECFNPLQEILFDSKTIDIQVLDQVGPMLMAAIGVALPEPMRIELLPRKEPFLSRIRLEKSIAILTPLVTLLVFSWIVWEMNKEVSHLQKERDGKIARITKMETLQAKLTLLKEKEGQIKQDLSQFPTSMIGSVPHQKVLREASQIVPDNVTLRLLSVQNKIKAAKGESPTDGERELHLTGLAFGSDIRCLTALAQIIEGLEKSPLFKNARLMSADENKLYTKPGTEFEIVCDIDLPGPKKEERR